MDQRKPHSVHGGLRKENLIKLTVESSENKEKIRFKVHEVELAASPIVCLHYRFRQTIRIYVEL